MFGGRDLFYKAREVDKFEWKQLEKLAKSANGPIELLKLLQDDEDFDIPDNKKEALWECRRKVETVAFSGFLRRLYQQDKQISQIVSYIWFWSRQDTSTNSEETVANQKIATLLADYFARPAGEQEGAKPGEELKKLLRADPRDESKPISVEAQLLQQVFPDYAKEPYKTNLIFPMFDEFELGEEFEGLGYKFLIDISVFHGTLADPTKNSPELFLFTIPYPPCPVDSPATVTNEELKEWIENRKPKEYFSRNPFIPTSCC